MDNANKLFERHYGDKTGDIMIGGLVPFANSLPINKCFLNKKLKKSIGDVDVENYMNVIFEVEQKSLTTGSTFQWSLESLTIDVLVLDGVELNVKGKKVWAYAIGIIN